jgi:aldehyde dehydrogenase (NAD(P)+)
MLGKPYSEALAGDVVESYSVIRYYAGWADKIQGSTIPVPGKFAYTLRQPLGVVGQIIPWNYPLANGSWKLGPALACGNTVVLKASEVTPLSILILGKLIVQAGFPQGVVNIINGYGRTAGAALASHPLVDKLSFTGSTATGIQVMTLAAQTLKNITVETGGKSPLIVFNDCDLDQTIKWSHLGIMSNQGQICTATSRILVQKDIAENFVSEFIKRIEETSYIGNQWDPKSYHGPQVSKQQFDRVLSYIETGKSEATLAYGGHAVKIGDGKGYFVSPTVFKDVKDDAKIWKEEIFGPVVSIKTFETEAEAIELANDTTYGLASAVFTSDIRKSHRMAEKLQSGMVWINSSQDSDFRVPFGGIKQSGIGRELGAAALDAYCQVKSVHVNMENDL